MTKALVQLEKIVNKFISLYTDRMASELIIGRYSC